MLGKAATAVIVVTNTFNTITTDDIVGCVGPGFFTSFNILSSTAGIIMKLGETQSEITLATTDFPLAFEGSFREIYIKSASTTSTVSMLVSMVEPTIIA